MAQLITVRLNKSDQQPLGFRLQGGKDFGTPLVVQKVNGGSAAERAGLQAGDALIRVNNTEVYTLRHQEAQDAIRAAGQALELTVQRGGGTWRPSVTPTGSLPRPGTRPLGGNPAPVTTTSLKATPQPSRAFGSGHNNVAKPFGYMNGTDSMKGIVNKQYNTPVNMYSDKTIAETLSAQTEVLAGGVLGVNFKKNEKTYDAEKSAVFKVLQEEQNDPEPAEAPSAPSAPSAPTTPVSGLRSVAAPVTRPDAPLNNTGGLPVGQNICEECERLITGVFVRIKDKNLHVECFKCSTCGTSLKNQGYYNLNGKLYCDIHAKLVARQNPPAANLEPVTVPPGGRIPTNSYTTPLPPLSTSNYTNGSSSLFSPSSNLSGPKPFGSSIGSAYSPSLSPRSAPMSPARPVAAPAPAPAPAPLAPSAPLSAPFAPTKNVKSIVWPPPNPPEDETPLQSLAENVPNKPFEESTSFSTESVSRKATNETKVAKDQFVSGDQLLSTSQETAFSSSVSFSSASMSAATTESSFAKSSVQSEQSHMTQELSSCTVQSFSEQASTGGQSFMVYQSEVPGHKSFNPSISGGTCMDHNSIHEMTKFDLKAKEFFKPSSLTIDTEQTSTNDLNIGKGKESKYLGDVNPILRINPPNINNYSTANSTQTNHISTSTQEHITNGASRQSSTICNEQKGNNTLDIQRTETNTNNFVADTLIMNTSQLQTSHASDTFLNTNVSRMSIQNKPMYSSSKEQSTNFESQSHSSTLTVPAKESYTSNPHESISYLSSCNQMIIKPNFGNEQSPIVDASTTIPNKPFIPVNNICFVDENTFKNTSSGSETANLENDKFSQPLSTRNPQQTENNIKSFFETDCNVYNPNNFQATSQKSAFIPVGKHAYSNLSHLNSQDMHSQVSTSAATTSVSTQGSSSVKTTQKFYEQLNKQESYSTSTMTKSELQRSVGISASHKDSHIPPLESITISNPKNVSCSLQENFNSSNNSPALSINKDHKPSSSLIIPSQVYPTSQELETKCTLDSTFRLKDNFNHVSMVSQPVSDESLLRGSPPQSRPSTPSLINKPAPIIPHYQMNLATVEHFAPESYTYQPSGGEGSRTPTPKPRPRTPSQGPSFKAQAPRIKDNASQSYYSPNKQLFSHQLPSTFQQDLSLSQMDSRTSEIKHPTVKEEHRSNIERQSESYKEGNMSIKKDSVMNQNYGQRQMESKNVEEYGKTTVHTTKKTFEEYERKQSAKMIEIKKGASMSSDSYQPIEALIRPSAINSKQTLPSPAMSFSPTIQSFSSNVTNENVDTTRQTHKTAFEMSPSISGANRGPVCDPPPSTGSSVGAAARGKTFGVSSAPKRGRGVLNKAVLPGSRVPLCASCNGNIRGPFISALGRIWCPEHFICVNATCRRPLQDIGFVEENGQLYCEFCFEQYIAPSCDKCHAKIKGDCLNAIGKHFHPECFSCVYCGKLFGNNPFFLEDGLPYCEADWNELFTTKCFACGFPVEAGDRWVEALNNNYHSQCFNCTVCKNNLEGQSFFAKGGRPFCKIHAR